MEGSLEASIVLPEPGGPIMSTPWPPAAAICKARFAMLWPAMSRKSGNASLPLASRPVMTGNGSVRKSERLCTQRCTTPLTAYSPSEGAAANAQPNRFAHSA